jgi:hypothetical protein
MFAVCNVNKRVFKKFRYFLKCYKQKCTQIAFFIVLSTSKNNFMIWLKLMYIIICKIPAFLNNVMTMEYNNDDSKIKSKFLQHFLERRATSF